MEEINAEIGLTQILRNGAGSDGDKASAPPAIGEKDKINEHHEPV